MDKFGTEEQMDDVQSQRWMILSQFAGTGAMPYLSGAEYRKMKGRFGKRTSRKGVQQDPAHKQLEKQDSGSSVHEDDSRASETAHPPTPTDGCSAPAAPAATFHRQLVGLLKRASFRKSRKMGNRGSNASAPSPDKKPPDPKQATSSHEVASNKVSEPPKKAATFAKVIPVDKDVKTEFWSGKTASSPRGSLVGSESGDSLVSSCSQESSKVPDVRIESTSSPDTSSISSSLFVDVQEKFYNAEEPNEENVPNEEKLSLSDEDAESPVFEQSVPPEPPPDVLPQTEPEPPSEPLEEVAPVAAVEDEEDEEDEDEYSFHDTQEDATDSSEYSPQKPFTPERRIGGTRSCPGTPDTHHASDGNVFYQYNRERKGSLGNAVGRHVLPTIGSVLRMNFRDEDDVLREDEEVRNFTGSTQSVHRFPAPHRHRYRNSPCNSSRRDRSSSELCLLAKQQAPVPQVIRRYCSQNLLVPNSECRLRRVSSLTLDKATIEKHVERPKFLPQELDFSLYEKFQGQMLVNWFCSAFPEDHHLSRHELRLMAAQFCTNLLFAGVLKHIDPENRENLFRMPHFFTITGIFFDLHACFLDIRTDNFSVQYFWCIVCYGI